MNRLFLAPLLMIPIGAHAAPQCSAAAVLPTPPAAGAVVMTSPPSAGAAPKLLSRTEIEASPALARIASRGAILSDLGASHGLRGVFARNGDRFQVFYVTPDQTAVIGGVMWDATGHDVTRDQVEPIEGTIPTVTYDAGRGGTGPDSIAPSASAALDHVTYGLAGRAGAPRVWMFVDPLCPFSVRAMATLQPYVDAGKVQLALIPISINDHENNGRSTAAALALLNLPKDRMVKAWTAGTTGGLPTPQAATDLANNMAAAQAIHLQGTPTIIWTTPDNVRHQAAGLPDDLQSLLRGRSA